MSDEDRPPERIWLDDEALEAHFENVKARYSSKSGSGPMEEVPDLQQNELTKGLKTGRR